MKPQQTMATVFVMMTSLTCIPFSYAESESAAAIPQTSLCETLFDTLIKSEPTLRSDFSDLNQLCQLDIAHSGPAYWVCVDSGMKRSGYTSKNLIEFGHECAVVEKPSTVGKY